MNNKTKNRPRHDEGFSLIELLIVVAIILIIAAIALPNLLRSRMLANEASTVVSMRTLNTAMVTYITQCPSVGFPASLVDLGPSAGSGCTGGANIVDNIIGVANPVKSGYSFAYAPIPAGTINGSYTLNADPQTRGVTGQRSFYTDQAGVIRYNESVPATVNDLGIQ